MTGVDPPFHPHWTGVEVVVRLGALAEVRTSTVAGLPLLEIVWGSITVLIQPHSAVDFAPIVECDVERGRDLLRAAADYVAAMEDLWAAQQAGGSAATLSRLRRDPDADPPSLGSPSNL